MSNPFATFRKNQKAWMAGLVLVAIFAFVIAPFFSYFNNGRYRGGEEIAVSWKGGSMSVIDVQRTSNRHASLVRFLGEIARRVIDNGGRPNVPGFRIDPASGRILDYGIPSGSSPNDVIQTRIMNTYGESLGVAFDDEAVDQFLVEYVNNKLSQKQVESILRDASGGQLTFFDVRELLKEALCFKVVQNLALTGLFTTQQRQSAALVSPGSTYSNFLKLNQEAMVEAFPVFAEDFLETVAGNPSEDELEAIFSVGSMRASDPRSPEPGFLKTYKTNLEFVVGDQQAWIQREKEKLTEGQIRAEYDRRVGLGQLKVPVETPSEDSGERPPSPTTTKPGSEPADETSTTEQTNPETSDTAAEEPMTEEPAADNPAQEEPATEEPAAEEPAAEEPAPAESTGEEPKLAEPAPEEPASEEPTEEPASKEPATEEPAPKEPAREEPAREEPAPEEPAKEDPKPESGDQSSTVGSNSIKLVSFQQEGEASAAAETQIESSESATETTEEADTQVDSAEPAVEDSSESPNTTGTDSTDASEETVPEEDADIAVATPAEPAMRTQTYEEAKETIATSLARDAALPALREALRTLIEDHMQPYYAKYREYRAFVDAGLDKQTSEERKKPERPNLKKLAEELGLQWDESGMVDGYTLSQTPVGSSFMMQSGMPSSQSTIANIIMNAGVDNFSPLQSIGFDSSAATSGMMPDFLDYVVWKVEEEEAYIPEFDEVRGEVVDAWKLLKARQLAEAAAKDLAKKVGLGENPWDEALSTTEKALVVETDSFAWMTMMSDFLNVTAVNKLEAVGNDFMREVFATPAGGVTVAPSANRDIFYIVRLKALMPSDEDLQLRFNTDTLKRGATMISNSESQNRIGDWFRHLENEMEVEYKMNVGQF